MMSNQMRARANCANKMAEHMMRLQQVTAALSLAQTEHDVADVVPGAGLALVESERAILALVDGDRFEIVRAVGYEAETRERLLALTLDDDAPVTRVVRTNEVLWLKSAEEHHRLFPLMYEVVGLGAAHSSVAVPLRHGDETVGALALIFSDSVAFGLDKQASTLLLAQAAADALFRARASAIERMARHSAETLAQMRADVLGIVAHDLRNPLNLIEWTTDSLLNFDLLPNCERAKMLDIMRRAAWRMNRLIGDLLDATQLQAGRLSLEISDVDARRVLREAQETFAPLAERHIELRFHTPPKPCFVRADEGRLLQAIGNLVTNALKFTREDGSVTVSARAEGSEVVFTVADDGPGIPEQDQPHLFDSFWQARNGDRRGIGLGLSITKDIVAALNGRIWVESTPGVGTRFSFAIPSPTNHGASAA